MASTTRSVPWIRDSRIARFCASVHRLAAIGCPPRFTTASTPPRSSGPLRASGTTSWPPERSDVASAEPMRPDEPVIATFMRPRECQAMAQTMQSLLEARVRAAVAAIAPDATLSGAVVTNARDPQHGDYSTPVAMQLAKQLKQAPLAIAEQLAAVIDVSGLALAPTVAPPGFVNVKIDPAWLGRRIRELVGDDRAGVDPADRK